MTQILQLLSVLAVACGLAAYAMWQDKKEHRRDSRQRNITFPADAESKQELVSH
jgi:hypothetical protein